MKSLLKGIALAGISVTAFLAADASAKRPVGAAVQQGPVLSMGGSVSAAAFAMDQKRRSAEGITFQTKGNVVFSVAGKSKNDLGYGAMVVLEADRSKSNSDRVSETWVFLNSPAMGQVKFGDTEGVESIMMYTGKDVLGALGGATSSDAMKVINITRGVDFYTSLAPDNDTATKLVYVSPTVHNFQLGVSYTPDTRQHGRSATSRYVNSSGNVPIDYGTVPYARKHLAAALSYNQVIQDFNVGLYLLGTTAKTHVPDSSVRVKNLDQWQVGTLVDYNNWQLGASYFDKGKAYMPINSHWTNTKGFNAGVGYDFAHNANFAVGYAHTYRKVTGGKARADIASATVEYVVAPGLVAYTELDYGRLRAPSAHITSTAISSTGVNIYETVPTSNGNNTFKMLVIGTKVRF